MAASNTQLARKAVNEVLSFFGGDDEDVNVNGLDKRNRERMVRAVARVLPASLTRFEREILAQALSDYSEGISEADYPDEEPQAYARCQAAVERIARKVLSDEPEV